MDPLLHHHWSGAGERVVVLLHGLLGLGSNLGRIARALATDCRVLVPDLRNHGRSFQARGMDYRTLATDLLRLLDRERVEQAALLGHSMGGKVAMQFALDHPARTARLLVADIAPVAYAAHHAAVFTALRAVERVAGADRETTRRLLTRHIQQPELVSLLLLHRARNAEGHWHWRLGLDALETGYTEVLAAPVGAVPYRGPVLFVRGELSDYIGTQHVDAVRALFPRAQLKVIRGAGHWLHAEKPEIFSRIAREFLLAPTC